MRHAHEAGCTPRAPPLSVRRPSAGATEKPRCAATRLPRAAVLRGTSSCSTALALLRRKQNAEQSGVQQLLMNVTLSTQRRSGHFSVRHKAAANVNTRRHSSPCVDWHFTTSNRTLPGSQTDGARSVPDPADWTEHTLQSAMHVRLPAYHCCLSCPCLISDHASLSQAQREYYLDGIELRELIGWAFHD